MTDALVDVRGLRKMFHARGFGRSGFAAVRGVSLRIERGSIFGLVGESGCGKTTLARSILYLDPPSEGDVVVAGTRLGDLPAPALRRFRRRMQIVFQDPNGAFNPKLALRTSLSEGLRNRGIRGVELARRVDAAAELVGIPAAHLARRPAEFSGGQKQRLVIARALTMEPEFLVLDEPVSNLDVSIQAQIVNLLMDLRSRLGLTYLFISHDLNLVSYMSDAIAVMYAGRIVELAPAPLLLGEPLHPYTRRLFGAASRVAGPSARAEADERPAPPNGGRVSVPGPKARGCAYRDICDAADPRCLEEDAPLVDTGGGHFVACRALFPAR